jgi:hypothetical protein
MEQVNQHQPQPEQLPKKNNTFDFLAWIKTTRYFKLCSQLAEPISAPSYSDWKVNHKLDKLNGYVWHHIVPREITNDDNEWNGVILTKKNHLYLHFVLAKEWKELTGSDKFYAYFNILLFQITTRISETDLKLLCEIQDKK